MVLDGRKSGEKVFVHCGGGRKPMADIGTGKRENRAREEEDVRVGVKSGW